LAPEGRPISRVTHDDRQHSRVYWFNQTHVCLNPTHRDMLFFRDILHAWPGRREMGVRRGYPIQAKRARSVIFRHQSWVRAWGRYDAGGASPGACPDAAGLVRGTIAAPAARVRRPVAGHDVDAMRPGRPIAARGVSGEGWPARPTAKTPRGWLRGWIFVINPARKPLLSSSSEGIGRGRTRRICAPLPPATGPRSVPVRGRRGW
jgi:hypothetical protein